MTLDEARKVAWVCLHADSGCTHCINELFEMLNERFSDFDFAWKASGLPYPERDAAGATEYGDIAIVTERVK